MRRVFQKYWTAAIPVAVLLGVVVVLTAIAARTDTGGPVYPLDDAYIHMALAKNLAAHDNWGLRSTGFSGVSSSPLWTLLLAGTYRLGAAQEWMPLVLNIIFGFAVVWTIYFAANRRHWPTYWTLCVSLAIVIWCPLFANVFSGMEHTLQVFVTLLLFTFAGESLAAGKQNSVRMPWLLMLLAALATAIRYEDCFLVFSICLMLAIQRRWLSAAGIVAAGVAPIVIYAIYSLSQGGMWAPASVLVKAWGISSRHALAKYTLVAAAAFKLFLNPYLIPLILTGTGLYVLQREWNNAGASATRSEGFLSDARFLFPIWIITFVLHLGLASIGWFYRYEAYLLTMGLFTLGALVAPQLPPRIHWSIPRLAGPRAFAMGAIALLMVVCLTVRSVGSIFRSPQASHNIQQQTYQVARFIHQQYPNGSLAINDIGAVAYFTDAKIVDLCGLGTIEVGREILQHSYDPAAMNRVCEKEGADAAIAFTCGFYRTDDLDAYWNPVATWTIFNNVASGTDTLTFYALRPQQEESLRAKLQAFAPNLPSDVEFKMIERTDKTSGADKTSKVRSQTAAL